MSTQAIDKNGKVRNDTFRQRVTEAEKTQDWAKGCLRFVLDHTTTQDVLDVDKLYRAYNGQMEQSDYNYVTNPYGSAIHNEGGQARAYSYPAKIRSYPIIKSLIDLLVGEKAKRFFGWQVVGLNSSSVNEFKQKLEEAIKKNLERKAIEFLNAQGVETGVPTEPSKDPAELIEEFNANYVDSRAIVGQEALDYIVFYNKIFDKFLLGFLDLCVTGHMFSFRYINHDEVIYEICSPKQMSYEKSSDSIFIEEANWVRRRFSMTNSEVIDFFSDEKWTKEELNAVEYPEESGTDSMGSFTSFIYNGNTFDAADENTHGQGDPVKNCIVEHGVWRAWRKIGFLSYVDEMGQLQEKEVDENYIAKDSVDDWTWVSDIWEGWRINNTVTKRLRRYPYQVPSLNPHVRRQPLPYNGRAYSDRHTSNTSVANIGLSFQALYNILHYRFEMTMARNKDKVILMDYNAIPKQFGWDAYKFMYFVDAWGFMFLDRSGRGADKSFNQYAVLDASLGEYAKSMIQIMAEIKLEYEDTLGINRQRKGQMNSSDGKATSEYAMGQSAVINEELFKKAEQMEERDLQYLLDLSKMAWTEGKKAVFINSNRRRVILDVEPGVYQAADFGVFATNTAKENDKLRQIKGLVDRLAQNPETDNATLAEIIDEDNFAKIKEIVTKADAAKRRLQERQMEMQQQQSESMIEQEQIRQDREDARQQKELDNNIDVEVIRQFGQSQQGEGGEADPQILKQFEGLLKERIEDKKLSTQERNNIRDNETKKYVADKSAETALKNKVPGEK